MGDVDDIDIYAAQPIHEWQQTEKGRWVMENATNLRYHTYPDPTTFGYKVTIRGDLKEKKATEYYLKWN
jgi:hypothetical protein